MNKDSKQQVSEKAKSLIEIVWERAKVELDLERDHEITITYPQLETLLMCVSGPREITIKNPYRNPRSDRSIGRHEEKLIADKFKALLKREYQEDEDSEWEIKWE